MYDDNYKKSVSGIHARTAALNPLAAFKNLKETYASRKVFRQEQNIDDKIFDVVEIGNCILDGWMGFTEEKYIEIALDPFIRAQQYLPDDIYTSFAPSNVTEEASWRFVNMPMSVLLWQQENSPSDHPVQSDIRAKADTIIGHLLAVGRDEYTYEAYQIAYWRNNSTPNNDPTREAAAEKLRTIYEVLPAQYKRPATNSDSPQPV